MPQRFLRPGITNSDAWNAVSFGAQSFFVRLLTLVDDWGRFDGRIPILHGQCFALRPELKPQHTAGFRSELMRAGLIQVYDVDGKDFIQLTKWQERTRGDRSKYPEPPAFIEPPQESAAERSGAQEKDASLATTPSPLHPRHLPTAIAPTQAPAWSAQDGWVGISDELRERWKQAYPACDISRQLYAMTEWLMANPKKATKSNWLRFATNWLASRQDRGGDEHVKKTYGDNSKHSSRSPDRNAGTANAGTAHLYGED